MSELQEQLRGQSHKLTGPRLAILELMRQHPHPMTNKEIHQALPNGCCDLATIYRSLHMLAKTGLVKRFDFGDGIARFELVTQEREHHHHLVCTECHKVLEIEECFADLMEQEMVRRHGFKTISHKLEFFGICPECQGR